LRNSTINCIGCKFFSKTENNFNCEKGRQILSQSAKHECKLYSEKESVDKLQKELNALKVKRTIEKTDIYNQRINELQGKIDFVNWGIC